MYWLDERICLTFKDYFGRRERNGTVVAIFGGTLDLTDPADGSPETRGGITRWLRSLVQQGRRADGYTAVFFHLLIEQHASGMKPLFDTPSEALRRRGTA